MVFWSPICHSLSSAQEIIGLFHFTGLIWLGKKKEKEERRERMRRGKKRRRKVSCQMPLIHGGASSQDLGAQPSVRGTSESHPLQKVSFEYNIQNEIVPVHVCVYANTLSSIFQPCGKMICVVNQIMLWQRIIMHPVNTVKLCKN